MKPILEPIPLGGQQTIIAFHHSRKNFETPWHFHPQHELTFIEASVGTKFIGDYVGTYEPGELVLLRSNVPHCWKNNVQKGIKAKSVVVQWNRGVFPKIPELEAVFDMLEIASKGIIFEKGSTETFIETLKTFPKLEGDQLYVQLLTLLLELTKCRQKTLSEVSFKKDLPSHYGSRMAKTYDFVQAHYNRKIYLKELADLINMSEQSFSRFFTKMMGRSFFTFLNEYRINMATRMLLDTDNTVSSIGFACGYESLPFFYRKFNEIHGRSPKKYRKQFVSTKHMNPRNSP